ncbi:hypothetical protein B484DRAFT_399042 [Ochromonadaceae sp. CCMP2298]|nr:hypothetical protein B484DRAFT_399042 [Ochromonadaceae sp. CCMP2298]
MLAPGFGLYTVFGLPTWALVDGTWAVLSQLADTLPEGYTISAYLILALTFGNLVPLILGISLQAASRTTLSNLIRGILGTGLVTGLLMAFLWNKIVSISGSQVSLALLILFFLVGACSSSSNVTHYIHVARSDASNTTALATGMGLGSMTAGILALLQGTVLIDYGFSVTYYYLVLALLFIPAIAAFSALSRQEEVEKSEGAEPYDEMRFIRQNWAILVLQVVNASLGYGIVPAMISYACSKFDDRSMVLLLSTGIAAVLDPLFKALTFYVRIRTFHGLVLCAGLPGDLSLYRGAGGVLPVSLYVGFGALFGFSNTCVFRYFKENISPDCVQHSYRWSGIASQSGALMGSLIAFSVVVTNSL